MQRPRFSAALVWLLLFLATASAQAFAANPKVWLRVNTSHGLANAKGAVEDAGLKLLTQVAVTPSSPFDGRPFLSPERLLEDGLKAGARILSSSFAGWDYLFDSIMYRRHLENDMIHVFAYVPRQQQPRNAPPPASFVTVNALGGISGDSIEFGVPTDYMKGKGQSPYPSGVTAQLAGLMACLKYLHPDWNWFDVKAALRSKAGNFKTGYDARNYGYGAIDYQGARALSDAAALPLFAPAAVVKEVKNDRIVFYVNSFKQTRRVADVLVRFSSLPAQHLTEMTREEIGALGGKFILEGDFSSGRSLVAYTTPDCVETSYFVWFSRDAERRFSRLETYSIIGPISLKSPLGPRLNKKSSCRRQPRPQGGGRGGGHGESRGSDRRTEDM